MRRRSNLLVLVGLVTFVLGLLAVFFITKDDDDGGGGRVAAGSDSVDVVVAGDNLTVGQLGDDLIAEGLVEIQRINRADLRPDAVTTQSQLSNTILTLSFAEGEQLRVSGLRPRSLLSQRVEIPEGFEGVAVSVGFVGGGAGYVAPGDRVNVYLVSTSPVAVVGDGGDATVSRQAHTELLLTNVTVLDVSQEVAPFRGQTATATDTTASRPTGERLTVLLSVTTADAEKVIFGSAVESQQLYVSLVRDDAPPAGPTSGIDAGNVLAEEPQDAFSRSNP